MTNTMTYKGYAARIAYDDEDGILTGQITGIRDGVGCHAGSVEALKEAARQSMITLRPAPRSGKTRNPLFGPRDVSR